MQKREVDHRIYTTAAKTKAGGNAQANIKIMPNCNANSKKSAKSTGKCQSWILLKYDKKLSFFSFGFYIHIYI